MKCFIIYKPYRKEGIVIGIYNIEYPFADCSSHAFSKLRIYKDILPSGVTQKQVLDVACASIFNQKNADGAYKYIATFAKDKRLSTGHVFNRMEGLAKKNPKILKATYVPTGDEDDVENINFGVGVISLTPNWNTKLLSNLPDNLSSFKQKNGSGRLIPINT